MKLKADAGYGYKALARDTIHRNCSVTDRPFDSVAIDVRSRLFRYIRLTCTKRTTWRKIRCVFGILVGFSETERVLQDALATMKAEVGMLSVSNAIYVLCSPTRCPFRARTLIVERDAHKARASERFDECIQHCKQNPLNVRKILECHKAFETYLITHIETLCLAYNDTLAKSTNDTLAKYVLSTADDSFESDRLCAVLEVDAVLSEDFDCVALFGAHIMIVSVDHDTASYVALSDVLRTFLCDSREQLVTKCCLMGTDYNLGMKGIGPATIQKIDNLQAYTLANQCMSLQAIDIDKIKHFFRIA